MAKKKIPQKAFADYVSGLKPQEIFEKYGKEYGFTKATLYTQLSNRGLSQKKKIGNKIEETTLHVEFDSVENVKRTRTIQVRLAERLQKKASRYLMMEEPLDVDTLKSLAQILNTSQKMILLGQGQPVHISKSEEKHEIDNKANVADITKLLETFRGASRLQQSQRRKAAEVEIIEEDDAKLLDRKKDAE